MASAAPTTLPTDQPSQAATLRKIRLLLAIFMTGLVLSGLTAFPLEREVALLEQWLAPASKTAPDLYRWIAYVHAGLTDSRQHYPFLAYGTDWLGFAHLVIAIAFWGPYRDPVRNRWVITWGILSCGLVLPLALICGPLRGIPLYWRLIDCSFGVLGMVPLWLACKLTNRLA